MKQKKVTPPGKHAAATNWAEIYRRLETARIALEQRLQPTAEQKQAILRARAKALAYEPEHKEAASADIEVVEFLLARERYGIESRYVREVYPLKQLTPLPCTPPFVLGMINVRGQIRSVIDLKQFFGQPNMEPTDGKQVIILHINTMEFGILADAVLGVRQVALDELELSLPLVIRTRTTFLKSIAIGTLVILDAEALLSNRDLVVQDEVDP